MAEAKPKHSAAYLPFATFLSALEHLKAISIPNQIEPGTFPSQSGQARSQILSAFRFFRLIDESGLPQPELVALVNKEAERKANIKRLIEEHYPDIVALDFAKMTPSQLDDKLSAEHYNIGGETKKKAKTFLLKAAQYAGFTVHPLLVKITRNRRGGGRRATNRAERSDSSVSIERDANPPKQAEGTEKTIELNNGGTITLSLNVNILELKGEDRKFVFELIDRLDVYESALPLD